MPGSLLPSHRIRLPQPIANYAVEDFPSFEGVLNQLEEDWQELQRSGGRAAESRVWQSRPSPSSAKSASPTTRGALPLTALLLGWVVRAISIINDFAAVARALPALHT